jgi:hypothetical protein
MRTIRADAPTSASVQPTGTTRVDTPEPNGAVG